MRLMDTFDIPHQDDEEDGDISNPSDPLLGQIVTPTNGQPSHLQLQSSSLTRVILYFSAVHFLLAFCQIVQIAPLIRLFENSLCLAHYGSPKLGVGVYPQDPGSASSSCDDKGMEGLV